MLDTRNPITVSTPRDFIGSDRYNWTLSKPNTPTDSSQNVRMKERESLWDNGGHSVALFVLYSHHVCTYVPVPLTHLTFPQSLTPSLPAVLCVDALLKYIIINSNPSHHPLCQWFTVSFSLWAHLRSCVPQTPTKSTYQSVGARPLVAHTVRT